LIKVFVYFILKYMYTLYNQNYKLMKKIFLAVSIGIAGLTVVKGQQTKGSLFIGTGAGTAVYNSGNYNYNYSYGNIKNLDAKTFELNFNESIGVYLTDHFVFGGSLNVAYNHEKDNATNTNAIVLTDVATTNATTFAIGPFMRYYFFNTTPSKTQFYVEAAGAIGTGSGNTAEATAGNASSSVITGNTSGVLVYRARGGLGLTHYITKNIGLDFQAGYLYNYDKQTTNYNSQTTNSGQVTSSQYSAKITLPTNGVEFLAGFHLLIP